MSNFIEKVKAKVDNVLNKDDNEPKHTIAPANLDATNQNTAGRDPAVVGTNPSGTGVNPTVASTNETGTHHAHHHHHHHHPAATTAGPTGTGVGAGAGYGSSTNTGPHDLNLLNKLDPRVDSDRDGSQNMGAASYGPGGNANQNTTGAGYGSSTTGAGNGSSTNTGPHNSSMLNKLDPRVDSDRDGSQNMGAASYGPGGSANQTSTGAGYGSSTTGAGYGSSTNTGPHNSNLLNKLDPRVDSDRDGSQNMGAASYGPGGSANQSSTGYNQTSNTNTLGSQQAGGYGGAQTTSGPHSSDMMNQLDPRVDSDNDGSRNLGIAQTGAGSTYNASTGPASATAGHHGSNLLNKLDPRVDSDASNNNVGGVNAHTTAHNTTY